MTSAAILDSKIICRQPGRYIGWPTIAKTPSGELAVVFSGDRDAHVCPFGKTFFMKSADNGRTWSDAKMITNTPLDDRDAGICACADGTLVVSWFTSHYHDYLKDHASRIQGQEDRWRVALSRITPEDVAQWTDDCCGGSEKNRRLGFWTRRSTDGGKTWEPPVKAPVTAPHGPARLSDGRLLFLGNSCHERAERRGSLSAAESRDNGRTWQIIGRASMFPPISRPNAGVAYLCEAHVVETAPGRLLGMARYEETTTPRAERRPSRLWQLESSDGGGAWTDPRETAILGKPPHLTRLADGRILLTYGYRHEPFGQRACVSRDEGRNWDYDREIVLRNDAPNGDLGYPASVECDDGTIATVYYQVDQPGEKTCLMLTRWRLGK